MECSLAVKGNAVLIYVTTSMNLENTVLSEKKPVIKDNILPASIYMTNP